MRSLPLLAALVLLPSTALAANVRPDHPRILFGNGSGPGVTLDGYKARCTQDDTYKNRCTNSLGSNDSLYPALADAAGYLVLGDASRCSDAVATLDNVAKDTPGEPDSHSFVSNNGRTMAQLAGVRDWCDGALSADQKAKVEQTIVAYADWYLAHDPVDVFHDDMPNVYASLALAGLALSGTAQDSKAQEYLAAADKKWKETLLPAYAYEGDWWHEGFVYVQPSLGGIAWYLAAWSTATDENLYAYVQSNANDLAEGYLRMHAYAWRPDDRYVYFGDTSDNKQSIELFSRPLVDMLSLGGSPLGQALSMEIKEKAQPGYDYAGANGWLFALLYDKSKEATATPRSSLPTARWLSPKAADVAVLRSGWGADDTMVYVSCGDYFGAHQHLEAGSFQIFRHAPLTGPTGYYDAFDSDHWANYYSQHSVHANTLSVYEPGEFFPTVASLNDKAKNVNDGGQRGLRRDDKGTAYPSSSLASYMTNKASGTQYETGDLVHFDSQPTHDYVACDVTAAYTSPGHETNGNAAKVSEVTRQWVFLKPDIVVVYDRIESTSPSFDKRFLLHAVGDIGVSGKSFTLDNGAGRLLGQTVYPSAADLNLVTNFAVEGTPHPPQSSGLETGKGTRLEVSPTAGSARDYFVHVFRAADPSVSQGPASSATEDGSQITVTIDAGSASFTLTLPKTGPLGGQLTVKGQSGDTVWQGPLGDGGGSGQGGSGQGGSGQAGTGQGGTSTGGQGGTSSGQGGTSISGQGGNTGAGQGGSTSAGQGGSSGKGGSTAQGGSSAQGGAKGGSAGASGAQSGGSSQGGAGKGGSKAGASGSSGQGGASNGGAQADAPSEDDSSGCGCRAAGSRADAGAGALAVLALAAGVRRRRKGA